MVHFLDASSEQEPSSQTSMCCLCFVRGRRWWIKFCTPSASPTVWRSSLWRMQDSNRTFSSSSSALPVTSLLYDVISSPFLLLTPSPVKHLPTSPSLPFPILVSLCLSPHFSLPSLVSPPHLSFSHLLTSSAVLTFPILSLLFFLSLTSHLTSTLSSSKDLCVCLWQMYFFSIENFGLYLERHFTLLCRAGII